MKNFILTVFSLVFFAASIFAQSGVEVTYLQKTNPRPNQPNGDFFSTDYYAQLVSNGVESTYRFGQGGEGKQVFRGDNNSVKIIYSDARGYVFYRNQDDKSIVSRDMIKDQPFIIKEDIPQISWEIKEETKEIGGYQCQLAVTTFRGRVYDAWFAQEIPLNVGPWKLGGLPGLILEAKARDGMIQFIFAGLKQVDPSTIAWNKAPRNGMNISFEGFFDTRVRKDEEWVKKISAHPGVTVRPAKKKSYFEIAK